MLTSRTIINSLASMVIRRRWIVYDRATQLFCDAPAFRCGAHYAINGA